MGWVTFVVLSPAERAVVDRLRRRKHTAYELRRHITVRRQTAVQQRGRGLRAGRVSPFTGSGGSTAKPFRVQPEGPPSWWRPADCLWDGDYRQGRAHRRVA